MVQKSSIDQSPRSQWSLLTNHGNVLLCIARQPTIRISEVARSVGIGERAAQKIIADLVDDGFLTRTKEGRRNRYQVNYKARFRHPLHSHIEIGPLLAVLGERGA